MFDFAGSELMLIGVLALVLIGPKDLPVAIKAVTQMIKKARRMAGEFQTHVDDLMREADMQEVRDGLSQIRKMDIKGQILKAVDGDGGIRDSLTNPLHGTTSEYVPPAPPPVPVADAMPEHGTPDAPAMTAEASPAPAFVPPNYTPKPPRPVPPAFIPPGFASAKLAEHA